MLETTMQLIWHIVLFALLWAFTWIRLRRAHAWGKYCQEQAGLCDHGIKKAKWCKECDEKAMAEDLEVVKKPAPFGSPAREGASNLGIGVKITLNTEEVQGALRIAEENLRVGTTRCGCSGYNPKCDYHGSKEYVDKQKISDMRWDLSETSPGDLFADLWHPSGITKWHRTTKGIVERELGKLGGTYEIVETVVKCERVHGKRYPKIEVWAKEIVTSKPNGDVTARVPWSSKDVLPKETFVGPIQDRRFFPGQWVRGKVSRQLYRLLCEVKLKQGPGWKMSTHIDDFDIHGAKNTFTIGAICTHNIELAIPRKGEWWRQEVCLKHGNAPSCVNGLTYKAEADGIREYAENFIANCWCLHPINFGKGEEETKFKNGQWLRNIATNALMRLTGIQGTYNAPTTLHFGILQSESPYDWEPATPKSGEWWQDRWCRVHTGIKGNSAPYQITATEGCYSREVVRCGCTWPVNFGFGNSKDERVDFS